MKNPLVKTIRYLSICLAAGVIACLLSTTHLSAQAPKYVKESIDASLVIPDRDSVSKQEYDLKKRAVQGELTSLDSSSKKILKGELDFNSNRDTIDKFFGRFLLPRMTQYDDSSISIGKERDRLLRDYLPRATNTAARDYLLDTVLLPFAKKVCEGNYHPAARVNAMYLIADVNRREGVRRLRAPTLDGPSLTYMIQTIDDASKPAFLKVPALQGIERHVGIDQDPAAKQINDATRSGIRDRMLKLVQQPYPGKPAEDDLLYFQQRIATRILGDLKDPGTANDVATQLKSMIANDKLRLWLRHDAIEAFGNLQFADAAAAKTLIMDTINETVKMVSSLARQQAVSIEKDILTMKENYLVFTGKDLTKIGVKKDQPELERASANADEGDAHQEQANQENAAGKVNLGNYRLNLARRQFKTVADTAATAINGKDMKITGGLAANLTTKDAEQVKSIAVEIRLQMRNVDRNLFSTKSKLSRTQRLRKNLLRAADALDPNKSTETTESDSD